MDEQSNNNDESPVTQLVPAFAREEELPTAVAGWSQKELELVKRAETEGSKPISPILSAQFFELFLEGYSCSEIAKKNRGLSEADILICRKKYKWDEEKDKYAYDLTRQVREKLMKQKLESLEFLTNMLAVTHKEHREKMLKYLQTGRDEDKPENWVKSPNSYKQILETIQKITGEDRVTTQKVTSESTVKVEGSIHTTAALHPELQAKLLKKLSTPVKQVTGKKEDE